MKRNNLPEKRAAERRGRRSELLATVVLVLKGYRILGRRVRTKVGEIDLVVRSPSGIVCFVEVKARELGTTALDAVRIPQQVRIARAAELYLAQRPALRPKGIRFDVVTVGRRGFPRHLRDAWHPQDWRASPA